MNELNLNMVYDKTLLDNFIHAVDVTLWNKACCCVVPQLGLRAEKINI